MFIDEQQAQSLYDFKPGMRDDGALVERHVWSPRACRYTNWTYEPLVRCDERGRMSGRRRCPFVTRPL